MSLKSAICQLIQELGNKTSTCEKIAVGSISSVCEITNLLMNLADDEARFLHLVPSGKTAHPEEGKMKLTNL